MMNEERKKPLSKEELQACLSTLQSLVVDDRQGLELLEEEDRIEIAQGCGNALQTFQSCSIQAKETG
jgi:signal recognition particle GTPase